MSSSIRSPGFFFFFFFVADPVLCGLLEWNEVSWPSMGSVIGCCVCVEPLLMCFQFNSLSGTYKSDVDIGCQVWIPDAGYGSRMSSNRHTYQTVRIAIK